MSEYENITEEFIRQNLYQLDWLEISKNTNRLSDEFLIEFQDKLNWKYLTCKSDYSEKLVRCGISNGWPLDLVFCDINVSEDFIREYENKLDPSSWIGISRNQCLSEEFIREFQDKVYWKFIREKQKLSDEFLDEFNHKENIPLSEYMEQKNVFGRE